jgi:hypothetical protein
MRMCSIIGCRNKYSVKNLCRKHYNKKYNIKNKYKIRKQQKEYYQKLEVKERMREYQKEYCQRPEVKERMREYQKEYCQRPEVKERMREYQKEYQKYFRHNNTYFEKKQIKRILSRIKSDEEKIKFIRKINEEMRR